MLGHKGYYPSGAQQISNNRLFIMFYSKTDKHYKDAIMRSMAKADGVVQAVLATEALGEGVNFVGPTTPQ